MADTISMRLTNKMNCFQCFRPRVEEFGATHSLSPKIIFNLSLCLDELITNIISYGYADFDEHPIDITLGLDGDELFITVEDDAQPFNILDAPEPELDTPLEERLRPIGGMGVHLVKSMMDTVNYTRDDDRNVVHLTKNISDGNCPDMGRSV